MKSLNDIMPAMYAEADQGDDSLKAFVSTFDAVHETLLSDIVTIGDIALADRTPASFLPNVADRYGNPFKFLSVTRLKSKVENLSAIYAKRGVKVGIVDVCYYLCGVIPVITEDFEYGWFLGIDKLGLTTRLTDVTNSNFWVIIPDSIPQAAKDEMSAIIEFMKPARSSWRFVLTAGTPPNGVLEAAHVVGEQLVVSGWSADIQEGAPVAWVDVLMDGESLGHADLIETTIRADVDTLMQGLGSTKDCSHSYFEFKINLSELESGAHVVTVVSHKHDGHMATIGTQAVVI